MMIIMYIQAGDAAKLADGQRDMDAADRQRKIGLENLAEILEELKPPPPPPKPARVKETAANKDRAGSEDTKRLTREERRKAIERRRGKRRPGRTGPRTEVTEQQEGATTDMVEGDTLAGPEDEGLQDGGTLEPLGDEYVEGQDDEVYPGDEYIEDEPPLEGEEQPLEDEYYEDEGLDDLGY